MEIPTTHCATCEDMLTVTYNADSEIVPAQQYDRDTFTCEVCPSCGYCGERFSDTVRPEPLDLLMLHPALEMVVPGFPQACSVACLLAELGGAPDFYRRAVLTFACGLYEIAISMHDATAMALRLAMERDGK